MYTTYENYETIKHTQSMLENTSISDITSTSSASSQSLSHYVDQYSNSYHQLMDDLSIIDDIYDNYDHDQLSTVIDTQVACSSKNGVLKHQMVQHLIGSESQFLGDIIMYQDHIASYIRSYSTPKNNKLLFKQIDCDILFKPVQSLNSIHQSFLDDLQQRLDIWGPTQLISDVFFRFFENMEDAYYIYIKGFSETLLTLDHLQKSAPFLKALESCYQLNSNLKEIGYYIQAPLLRLKTYTTLIQECLNLTEPTHPDYNHLANITQKYKTRQNNLQPIINDCLSHYRVYEYFHNTLSSPALLTPTRRLLLVTECIHIDPSSPSDLSDIRTYLLYNDLFVFSKKLKDGKKYQHKGIITLTKTILKPLEPKIITKIQEKKAKLRQQQQQQQQQKSSASISPSTSSTLHPSIGFHPSSSSSSSSTITTSGNKFTNLFKKNQRSLSITRTTTNASIVSSSTTSTSSASSIASSNSSHTMTDDIYGFEMRFNFIMEDVTRYSNPVANGGGLGYALTVPVNIDDSSRRHILVMKSQEEQNIWMDHLRHMIKSGNMNNNHHR
ncbi:unnamed protein product [Cunninghamella blakesleeana]